MRLRSGVEPNINGKIKRPASKDSKLSVLRKKANMLVEKRWKIVLVFVGCLQDRNDENDGALY